MLNNNHNGNNNGKTSGSILHPVQTPQQAEAMPQWMQQMWAAARGALTDDRIRKIVEKQIEKAEAGDEKAMRFLFETVMGGSAFKGATFVQKNETHSHSHYHEQAEEADAPEGGRTPAQYERDRRRHAARIAAGEEEAE